MRVTLVGSGAGIGGTERHLASLVRLLPGRGFAVELITSERGELTRMASDSGAISTVIPRPGRLSYLIRLTAHFRRTRPDVVHAHSGRLPCLAARLARVPWVLDTRHGHLDPGLAPGLDPRRAPGLEPGRGAVLRVRWRVEGLKGRLAHRTLTVCQTDATTLIERGGLPAALVRTVYNGVPNVGGGGEDGMAVRSVSARNDAAGRETSRDRHDRALLGWVGRMADEKAPLRLLEVLAGLAADAELEQVLGVRVRLELVGDGPLRSALETEARRLGVDDRVEFRGALADPSEAMGRLRLLLLPSRVEGLPYVLLEALAAGTPVMATPVGGIGEVLTGELSDGLLPWDPDLWVGTAGRILRDEAVWLRAHEAALARIQAFSEGEMAERIGAIYREGAVD